MSRRRAIGNGGLAPVGISMAATNDSVFDMSGGAGGGGIWDKGSIRGLHIDDTETYLYLMGYATGDGTGGDTSSHDAVHQFTMSTPGNLATAGSKAYLSLGNSQNPNWLTGDGNVNRLLFGDNIPTPEIVRERNMTTTNDLSTSVAVTSYSVTGTAGWTIGGGGISRNGRYLYCVDIGSPTLIRQITLNTPFTLPGATAFANYDIGQASRHLQTAFNGARVLYTVGTSVRMATLTSPYDIRTFSSQVNSANNLPFIPSGAAFIPTADPYVWHLYAVNNLTEVIKRIITFS